MTENSHTQIIKITMSSKEGKVFSALLLPLTYLGLIS